MTNQRIRKISLVLLLLFAGLQPSKVSANPYVVKSGESPVTVRVATCAISGGFIQRSSGVVVTGTFTYNVGGGCGIDYEGTTTGQ